MHAFQNFDDGQRGSFGYARRARKVIRRPPNTIYFLDGWVA